jgi:pectin methylesterase-like acyl-CoA thioesterase
MQMTFAVRGATVFILGCASWLSACGSGSSDSAGVGAQGGNEPTANGGATTSAGGASGANIGGMSAQNGAGQSASAGIGGMSNSTGSPGSAGANTSAGGASAGGASAGGAAGASTGAGAGGTSPGGSGSSGAAAGGGAGTGGAAGQTGGGGLSSTGPLPPSVTGLFPGIKATGVCLDAPLTMAFASAPSIGTSGTIAIYASASPNAVVDSIDIAAASYSDTIGGQARNLVRPVFIDGNDAVIYFHQHKLAANTSYFVTVTSGTFLNAQKNPIGTVTGSSAWTFTTGPAPAAAASMSVNRTGSGNFCTVQGAFDAVPANNTTARTITVAAANYHEILYLSGKKNLTLQGADRAGTLIEYPNNDNLNSGTSARPLFFANATTGLSIENLTIYNTTPQDGSQAEALRIQGDQVILRNANFKSLQDTLLLAGRVYVVSSYVEGNVDFVWGTGVTYFDQCEIKTVGRAGAIVQARNTNTGYGYVFVDSKLTSDPNITGQVLARIDATQFPYSHVAYVNCQMSSAISPKGWTITPTGTTQTGNLRFWEYQSTDPNGVLLDVSKRDPASLQLSSTQAATMRDKATVLAGWNPQ